MPHRMALGQCCSSSQHGWRPVAYASRSMTDAETQYAQIEKEALALTWACEKFSPYILGMTVQLETDHKPLVPLLSHTHLDNLPPRVLRFCLRLMRFSYTICHMPGKLLYTADALSRCPMRLPHTLDIITQQETVESHITAIVMQLPASEELLKVYRSVQMQDPLCSKVINFTKSGWPSNQQVHPNLKPF